MGFLVSSYIQHFSYFGLLAVLVLCGLGLPFPEDIALLAGGFLVHRGVTAYPATIAVSLVGVVAGDNSLFLIGRRFGTGLLTYFGLGRPRSRRKIERMRQFMQRHGSKTIFYARFFAGLRAVVYLSAGSLGVSPGRFFVYDLLGALISVPLVVSLGYLFGEQLDLAIHYAGGFERVILIAAAASLLLWATRYFYFSPDRESD
ncbi:MAG: DedA family protein [Candidatus Binataceae bacterium]|nr:DedA family protein [Candidatus Binataceae bacterium]